MLCVAIILAHHLKRCELFFDVVVTPASIYLFKVNSENTRAMCEICSKLPIKTPERRQRRGSCAFIINFKQ